MLFSGWLIDLQSSTQVFHAALCCCFAWNTQHYTPHGHSSLTHKYLYISWMNFDILSSKTQPFYLVLVIALNRDHWTLSFGMMHWCMQCVVNLLTVMGPGVSKAKQKHFRRPELLQSIRYGYHLRQICLRLPWHQMKTKLQDFWWKFVMNLLIRPPFILFYL